MIVQDANGRVWDKEAVQALVVSNEKATARALLAIYARQTAAEQSSRATVEHNERGFTGFDAGWLSKIAQKYQRYGRWYNAEQQQRVGAALRKYHRQLLEEIAAKPGSVVLDGKQARARMAQSSVTDRLAEKVATVSDYFEQMAATAEAQEMGSY